MRECQLWPDVGIHDRRGRRSPHGDKTEFAVPFQSPRLRVYSQTLDAITPHTPVSAVQVPYPVPTLLNRRVRDALNSCTKAERVVIPVGLGTPGSATED